MAQNLESVHFEKTEVPPDRGFQVRFVTMKHNSPLHWHREMEILYILNGSAVVHMKGEKWHLKPLDLLVVDSSIVHDVIYALPQTMGICIHISKSYMRRFMPEVELLQIVCTPDSMNQGKEKGYMNLCQYLKELTVLYFEQKQSYLFRCSATILQIMAQLVEDFGMMANETMETSNVEDLARVEQIFQYVEKNYKEQISLQEASDQLGLNKEYFCRFFKRCTGMTFLQYVNQVRLSHIYQDLLYSKGGIQEVIEKNGMYNVKLFYRIFKERYGCTPREVQKMGRGNPLI